MYYATTSQLVWLGIVSAIAFGLNSYRHYSQAERLDSLEYKSSRPNNHRHYIDISGTTSGPPINPDGSYLSGAWF